MESFTMEIDKEKSDALEHVHKGQQTDSHGHTALNTEADLSEREESFEEVLDDDDHKHIDYSNYTKAQFVSLAKDLARENNFRKVDNLLKEIKPLYDEHRDKERSAALEKFTAAGGDATDFEYKGDDLDSAFDANLKLIRDRRAQYFRQQEEQKNENFRKNRTSLKNFACSLTREITTTSSKHLRNCRRNGAALVPSRGHRPKHCGQTIMRW